MDFTEPISYPLKDLKKLLIGGLLIFPGVILLLIPAIIAMGYTIKAAGDTVRGKDELPEFDDWGYFLMKGFGYFGIGLVYCIIGMMPAVLILGIVFWQLGVFSLDGTTGNIAVIILGIIIGIIAVLFAIIVMFMIYISLVRYGEKENIGAGFAFKEILRNFQANLGDYIIGFVILIVVNIVISIFQVALQITLIGILFIGVLYFYYYLVSMRMFAQIYKETKEKLGEN